MTEMQCTADQLPTCVLEQIFFYLSWEDLQSCLLVCKSWFKYLNDGNSDVWRYSNYFY